MEREGGGRKGRRFFALQLGDELYMCEIICV